MPSIPFPKSSTPGARPGEGEGRLINAYVEKAGDTFYWRRGPGLEVFVSPGIVTPRGLLDVAGRLYAVYPTAVVHVDANGTMGALTGTIPGSDGVTLARNNRVPDPDIVAVQESGGAHTLTAATVATYSDADLPAGVNSVSFMDGFFLFTVPDGRIFASDLNSTAVNALSFATAEGAQDGLKRGIVHGGVFYAMGTSTIEPWLNVGNSPFPLTRGTSVIPVGLLATFAVAGAEEGWDHPPVFVAHDGTVRILTGYQTKVVSTPDVERFIAASSTALLEAVVYTVRGHAFWSLSSDQGTWVYDVMTGAWHERTSLGRVGWRGSRSVKSNGVWRAGDRDGGNILTVSDAVRTEGGSAVEWRVESSPLKEYPARVVIPSAFADFTEGVGGVSVSWSHDGGKTWSTPLTRSLTGVSVHPVRVNRLGLSSAHGLRLRLASSDSSDFSFLGASVPDPAARRP